MTTTMQTVQEQIEDCSIKAQYGIIMSNKARVCSMIESANKEQLQAIIDILKKTKRRG